jgi:trk system potassium uptake protein TrkA
MYIVVIGCGKVGRILTQYLSSEEHDVVVIDTNQDKVEDMVHQYDVLGLCGNGANYDILLEAGVEKADVVISVTTSDELNILAGLMAKRMGAKHLIARVRNPDYSKQKEFLTELGFSMIVNPESEAANEIRRMIMFPSAMKVDTFAKGLIELIEIKLKTGNRAINVHLSQLHKISRTNVLICAVSRGDKIIIPSGDFELKENDHIYITGTHRDLSNFSLDIGAYKQKIKNVMIIGGSRLAFYLTRQLLIQGIKVKIIEKDHHKCEALAEQFPSATIIEADGSDEEVLLEEGIENIDSLVALTGLDEENLILALAAKQMGVKKAIAKVNRTALSVVDSIGVDNIISPKTIISSQIIGYLRAQANDDENDGVKTLYKLLDGQIESLEFVVTKKFKYISQKLMDMKLKDGVIIAGILRGNHMIIPNGSDTIEVNDHVIIISKVSRVKNLNDILEV